MSREFGSYINGYLHTQIEQAAQDCSEGRCEITKRYAPIFEILSKISYSICSAEACDSGEYDPIMKSIEQLPLLKEEIARLEQYLQPFKDVMDTALREKVEK